MGKYVLIAVGDEHVKRTELSVEFLRRFGCNDIVVVQSRTKYCVKGVETIDYYCPPDLSDLEASRYLKTGLHFILDNLDERFCYLDSDALPVSPKVGDIFSLKTAPIEFATDHQATVLRFGRHALNGETPQEQDLAGEILRKFQVTVDPNWNLWNGGVFLFDRNSEPFLETWHGYTMDVFKDPRWKKRDQGTLTAAAWKHNLQNKERLPQEYNWLVRHSGGYGSSLKFEENCFYYEGKEIKVLHFIPGHGSGYGKGDCWEWNAAMDLACAS